MKKTIIIILLFLILFLTGVTQDGKLAEENFSGKRIIEKYKYAEMLPHEIVERRKDFPVAFIGLGILEWHGEHLAVGTDGLKADGLCELAAERSGGFAFPTLWYGESIVSATMDITADDAVDIRKKMRFKDRKYSKNCFEKTWKEQEEFYGELIYHMLVQMNMLEMKAVVFLCGHYPILIWIRGTIDKFNKRFNDTKAFAGSEQHFAKHEDVGVDHAAKWETSYLWFLMPDCVDMEVFKGRNDETLIGVIGNDPRKEASVEVGRKGVDLIVEGMIKKAKELLKEAE